MPFVRVRYKFLEKTKGGGPPHRSVPTEVYGPLPPLAIAIHVVKPVADPASSIPRNASPLDKVATFEQVSRLSSSQVFEQPLSGTGAEEDATLTRFSINDDSSLVKVYIFQANTDDLADSATG